MRNINQSKGKYELIEWLERKSSCRTITNSEFYNIDIDQAKLTRNKALTFLSNEVNKAIKE